MKVKAYISAEVHEDESVGPWLFKIKRGSKVEAVGTSDGYQVIVSMALEAMKDAGDGKQ